jgi:uncharacterized protein Yka (UPF0111/DUF47 family)
MGQVDIQRLQQMVEALTKRVDALERQHVPNVDKRVCDLEDYADKVRSELSSHDIVVPRL